MDAWGLEFLNKAVQTLVAWAVTLLIAFVFAMMLYGLFRPILEPVFEPGRAVERQIAECVERGEIPEDTCVEIYVRSE